MSWSEANDMIEVSARTPEGVFVGGRIVVMAMDRVSLRFPLENAPVLGLGRETNLQVIEILTGVPFELPARVTRRLELEDERQYEFQLTEPQMLWNALSEDALVLVSLDPTSRAQPAAEEPILVTMGTGENVVELVARLSDVSVVGLAMVISGSLPEGVGETLAGVDRVHLAFRLPNCPTQLRVWATIRRRSLTDQGRRYGVMFDEKRTKDLAEVQRRIGEYVMQRRREEALAVGVDRGTKTIQSKISAALWQVSVGFVLLAAGIALYAAGLFGEPAGAGMLDMLVFWVVGGAVLIGALGVWLARFIARRLSEPIQSLTRVSTELAEGNLDVSVNETGTRELQILSASFNRMAERIQELLIDVRQKARTVEKQKAQIELGRAKDEFLVIASHELRTPLTSILSFAEILLTFGHSIDSEESMEFLHIIRKEAQNLANLINQFLDLTRMQGGLMQWDVDEMDLGNVVTRAATQACREGEGPGVALLIDIDETESWLYRGDEHQVFQVVLQLVQNGRKFSPEGADLEVKLVASDWAFEVHVADRGCGVPANARERIFDKFVQARDVLTDRPGGTGLGLSITREIVEFHGGHIECFDRDGGGTEFVVRLPFPESDRQRPVDKYWMLKIAAQEANYATV